MQCGMLFGLTTRNAEQDIQSPKFFAVIVPARAVLAEQIFDHRAAEPSHCSWFGRLFAAKGRYETRQNVVEVAVGR